MSTTIFAGNTAGIVYEGGVPDGSQFNTPNFFGGEYIQQAVGTNAKLRVNFTGTDCDLYVYCDGGTWGWTIDGGSLQTASPSGGNMQWLNVATGLSDTTHTLELKTTRYFVGWDKILRVTGAAPALSAPAGYTNPQFGFTSSGVTRDGSAYRTSAVEGYLGITDHGSCRFKATTSSIKIWNRYDLNYPIGLVVDDDITTLTRQNPSYGWGWTEFTGLDGSNEHSYRLIIPNGVYVYNFMAAGLNTAALTAYPVDYWMGDSITANSTITNGDAAPGYFIHYAVKAKRGWQVQAQGGATAATQGVAWKTYPGLASPTPDRVIIAFGTNDLGNAEPSATWTSAITSIITQIHSDLPTKKVVWLGLFDTSFNHANRGTYNTDLSNTITTFGSSLVTYFSTDGTGTVATSDSVHPDATGSATVGNYLYSNLDGLPAINGTASTTVGTTTASTAVVGIAATAATTVGTATASTGTLTIGATAATTVGTTTSSTAAVRITATAATTVGTTTVSTATSQITAAASTTVGTVTASTGTVRITGTAATTVDTITTSNGNTTGGTSPINATASTTVGTATTSTAAVRISATGATTVSTNTVGTGVVRIAATASTTVSTTTTSTATTGGTPTVDSNVYVFLLGA